jgi:ribosomal protein S18 acetylase RimI-like enzyme
VQTESDDVIEDFIAGMALLSSGVPGGYQERGDGVVLNVIGLDSPSTNTLHILEPSASRSDAQRFVERLQQAGLPFVFRVRPDAPDWVDDLAAASGLLGRVEFPIMRMVPAVVGTGSESPTIVEVDPGDRDLVRDVTEAFTAGNEVPPGVFDQLVAPAMFDRPEVAVYAALEESSVTSVGIRLQVPGAVGVFGVATPPRHRRRGLGEAVTARIVRDGIAAGARSAFLGATPMGLHIYERLGFRTVETWTFHVPSQN